jgi:hypothetical protein
MVKINSKQGSPSMRATEHAKLSRLLSNIEYLGDVGKAAATTRVSRSLLDKWMNMPGVSWKINTALNEAQAMLRCEDTAEDILFRAKLHKDAAVFQATGKRHRELTVAAQLSPPSSLPFFLFAQVSQK